MASKKLNADSIYERVLSAIFERKLHPGTRLKEEELCEVFGIGRGSIRKVLHRLAHEKLVKIVPNSGAFISEPSVSESKEVFQARRLIEAELVRELTANLTKRKIETLKEHVAKEQKAREEGDYGKCIRLSGEYHLLIGELADKPVLTEFLQEIISRTSLIIALYERTKPSPEENPACCDHNELISILESGDADKAVALTLSHLNKLESALALDPPEEEVVDLKRIFSG